jgi:hypothetical protein
MENTLILDSTLSTIPSPFNQDTFCLCGNVSNYNTISITEIGNLQKKWYKTMLNLNDKCGTQCCTSQYVGNNGQKKKRAQKCHKCSMWLLQLSLPYQLKINLFTSHTTIVVHTTENEVPWLRQSVSQLPLNMKAQVWSQANPCEISGGQSCTKTSNYPSTSVFPWQHHPTNAPYFHHLTNKQTNKLLAAEAFLKS